MEDALNAHMECARLLEECALLRDELADGLKDKISYLEGALNARADCVLLSGELADALKAKLSYKVDALNARDEHNELKQQVDNLITLQESSVESLKVAFFFADDLLDEKITLQMDFQALCHDVIEDLDTHIERLHEGISSVPTMKKYVEARPSATKDMDARIDTIHALKLALKAVEKIHDEAQLPVAAT